MSGVIELTLERDGHDQPWGFRLQGGHDVGLPMTVQRILVGTPAEGILRKGDIVHRVSCTDAKGLSHQQAADLFNNAGNQIQIYIRRPGAHAAAVANAVTGPGSPKTPISGGIAMPGLVPVTSPAARSPETLLLRLPKSRVQAKPFTASTHQALSSSSSPLSLTIQNQPYRTSPLIQPTASKTPVEIGPGSVSHLKMQADYITGAKEAQPSPDAHHTKATEFVLKQKVTGSLQQIQNQPVSNQVPILQESNLAGAANSPVQAPMQSSQVKPVKQFYNNPINLYSTDNVNEVAKLNHLGISGGSLGMVHQGIAPGSPTGIINPNRPQQIRLNPSKDYNPRDSATWQALQETNEKIDPEKVRNYSSLKEHDAVFSEVYAAPSKQQFAPYHNANSPPGPSKLCQLNGPMQQQARSTRSPVAEFLPPHLGGGKIPVEEKIISSKDSEQSAVLLAALAESKTLSPHSQTDDSIPIYETNSLGERRRITQSASFNRLMMDIIGE